jgi:hypothetical protein
MPDFMIPSQRWTADMWREAIKAVVRFGAQPREDNLDDVVTAGWVLGQKRADLRGRPFWPGMDTQHPLTILCWVVFFKPGYAMNIREEILSKRWELVRGIDESLSRDRIDGLIYQSPEDNEHVRRMWNLIPDDLLKMPVDELYDVIRSDEGHAVARSLRWP